MNGLKEFGDFEIICWELKTPYYFLNRILRILEFKLAYFNIKKIIQQEQPDMIIAERTTSYGLAALSGIKPSATQQGGKQIYGSHSILLPLKD
jgi:hypothetical protein